MRSCYRNKSEQAVAKWTFINNKRAGAGTDTLSDVRSRLTLRLVATKSTVWLVWQLQISL